MTFEDIESGNTIVLTISNGERQATLNSRVINVIDGSLLCDPFESNGGIVNFPANLDIEMMVVRDNDVPLYWQRVHVDQQKYHERTCHVIKTNLPGIKYNRRSSFRVPLTAPVKLEVTTDSVISATLKDLSTSSYSILVDKNKELELHKKICVQYTDQPNQKYFELTGRPVRKTELQNYNLYGCIMDKRYPELDGYLAQKQLETRRNRPE